MRKKNIVVVSHDATLTGAPILLLNFLDCIIEQQEFNIKIIIKNKLGELEEEFKKRGEITYLNKQINYKFKTYLIKFFILFGINKKCLRNTKIQGWINKSDILLLNTITNGDLLQIYKIKKNTKVISYIHELKMASEYFSSSNNINQVINKSNFFLFPSNAVQSFLINNLKIPNDKTFKLNYFIPKMKETFSINNIASFQKNKFFVIGMIGTLDWRKGADLIPSILRNFFFSYPKAEVKFAWKGANPDSLEIKRINYELGILNLQDKIFFESPTLDIQKFYLQIDLLLLCSREDPYPLVVLEAAQFNIPTICFNNTGGASEFIQNDAGSVIQYLDFETLSNTIFEYYSDTELTKTRGEVAKQRYIEWHSSMAIIQNQFRDILRIIYDEN